MSDIIGENIDRIMTVEMRTQTPPRGVIHRMYESARHNAKLPLAMAAAQAIVDHVRTDGYVVFLTGAGGWPSLPKGETDGPPGAASLARALDLGLGAKPIFLSDETNLEPIIASCEAAGLTVGGVDEAMLRARPHSGIAMAFPVDPHESKERARELLDHYEPQAVIAIERLGPSAKGVFHSCRGFPLSCAPLNLVSDLAHDRGILTIGVGDNGNEIGCGSIWEDVREIQPWGKECRCPCQSGMATVSTTDFLVIASVSNWGAYAIAACLAYLLGNTELLHDTYMERRMLEMCVEKGGVDGELGMQVPSTDGISLEVQQAVVTMMHEVVRRGLRGLPKEVSYPE